MLWKLKAVVVLACIVGLPLVSHLSTAAVGQNAGVVNNAENSRHDHNVADSALLLQDDSQNRSLSARSNTRSHPAFLWKPARVCILSQNPRTMSLFHGGRMDHFGSRRYEYHFVTGQDTTYCNVQVEVYKWKRPVPRTLRVGPTAPIIKIFDGDEFCDESSRAGYHFAQYWSDNIQPKMQLSLDIISGFAQYQQSPSPIYLPLGPRYEFQWVKIDEIVTAANRKYLYNYVVALSTSSDRLELHKVVEAMDDFEGFVHVIKAWHKDPGADNEYLNTDEFRAVVLDSVFTLCPSGHNPESFRLFEALEAGSIPIIARNDIYNGHVCKDSLRPLIEAGAPIIVLDEWGDLPDFLSRMKHETAMVSGMQTRSLLWYHEYFRRVANDFESVLDWMRVN